MPDQTILQLFELTDPASNDLIPIVDISEPLISKRTKHISLATLFGRPTLIGNLIANSASFTTLQIGSTAINEFSIDGTLIGNSDTAVPTEQAVKTYVDAQISLLTTPKQIVENDSNVTVNDLASIITATIDGNLKFTISTVGILLESGGYVNDISNDTNLTDDSGTALVTEHAVKTYVDNASFASGTSGTSGTSGIGGSGTEEITRDVYSDTTASAGEILFVDSSSGNIYISLQSLPKGKITIKKISNDSNYVIITSSDNYYIDDSLTKFLSIPYHSLIIYSHETIFYIL